jgi:hypothetical protein
MYSSYGSYFSSIYLLILRSMFTAICILLFCKADNAECTNMKSRCSNSTSGDDQAMEIWMYPQHFSFDKMTTGNVEHNLHVGDPPGRLLSPSVRSPVSPLR